ncbi:histidine phosphatase family protein [Humidisolicoccus flavus]|uniref:histidine phosphatase family protein n=1 Tax=Humidisolicoccus flavus TaxID=3111414 RepID=UPI0032456FF5
MSARRIHLVRHGEVHNPQGVLYGRLDGFPLSDFGHSMAAASAEYAKDWPIVRLHASPLERAQQSATPWSERFDLPIQTEPRIIEPHNRFQGKSFEAGPKVILHPKAWPLVRNPFKPSWGEAYALIAERMVAAMEDAWDAQFEDGSDGHIAMVSHQLPIWTTHRFLGGEKLWHDPRKRRCALSSITSFERRADGTFFEVAYADPAAPLGKARDLGAV